jgi:adenylate cyclase
MALAMRRRLQQLNLEWRRRGIDVTLKARMGLNTGYCNIGSFGSNERKEYTIVGAEANLTARLQSLARPGGIMIAAETYGLVRDLVKASAQTPFAMPGSGRMVTAYALDDTDGAETLNTQVISEHGDGVDLFIDIEVLDDDALAKARRKLVGALAAIDRELDRTQPAPRN